MPRMTLNLSGSNVEMVELTFDEVKILIEDPNPKGAEIQGKIETAIDEAYQEIAEGNSEIEYVVIKISK